MLGVLLNKIKNYPDLQNFFYHAEIIFICIAGLVIFWFQSKTPESNFKVTEAELKKVKAKGQFKVKRSPLRLTGIRINGSPHEILGISPRSTPVQIQQAYRDLMKRYHPDRVGPQGSREWNEAQKIAEAINRAKEILLKGK